MTMPNAPRRQLRWARWVWITSFALFANCPGLVRAAEPLRVRLVLPPDNSTFVPGDNLRLLAESSDFVDSLTRVDFFAGTNFLGSTTNGACSLVWSNVPAGRHALTALALDWNGMRLPVSTPVQVAIAMPEPEPRLGWLPGSPLHLQLRGSAGGRFELQCSDDFTQWSPLGQVTLSGDSSVFAPAVDWNLERCFFRAVEIENPAPWPLDALPGDRRVTLRWPAVPGVSGCNIYLASASGVTRSNYATLSDGRKISDARSPFIVSNLLAGQTYSFVVTALSAAGETPESNEERVTVGRHRLAIVGSSVALGWGSTNGNSWARRLAMALGPDWEVVNKSVAGNSSQNLLDRFDRDIGAEHWDAVIIALSLANEGILWFDADTVFQGYTNRLGQLVQRVRGIGAVPVVTGAYPNNQYTPLQYDYCRRFNRLLAAGEVAGIDFMGTVDDDAGHWAPGLFADAWHPNDQGHEEMLRAIPLSLFDRLLKPRLPAVNRPATCLRFTGDVTTRGPLSYASESALHSFTMGFWFRRTVAIPGKALCGIGTGASRVRTPYGVLQYTPASGAEIISTTDATSDLAWHHCVITHSAARDQTWLYVDGRLIGSTAEHFDCVASFVLGGRGDDNAWANGCDTEFFGWTLHRTCLDSAEVGRLWAGMMPKGSLELNAPLADRRLFPGALLMNLAPNNGAVKLNTEAVVSVPFTLFAD